MKNLKKFITTLLVALMAFAAVPGSAFAAANYTSIENALPNVEKTVTFQNYDQSQAQDTYTFYYDVAYNEELSATATGYAPVAPTVPNNPVGTVSFKKEDFTQASLTKTGNVTFNDITFNAPGVYVFNVTEVPVAGFQCYDQYTAYVTVENGEKAGELEVTYVVYVKGVDQASPETDATNKLDRATFENDYQDNTATLEVQKLVEGPFGDKTKQFEFTVQFTDITDEDFNNIQADPINGVTVDPVKHTITFKLKDTDKVALSSIPVGAHYTVAEANPGTGYDVSATVNGATAKLTDYTTLDKSAAKGDVVVYTNTATQSPVTGFVMNMLPYVGILVIAGVAVALVMKRRSTSNF